jgi:hypothetical protein
MPGRRHQSGLSIIGFIFVAAVVVSLALLGFRVTPSYIEYFAVEKTLRQTLAGSDDQVTLTQFRRDFDLKASADYIDSVRSSDVELTHDGNRLVASASWTVTLPLFGNVSLLLDFNASATK